MCVSGAHTVTKSGVWEAESQKELSSIVIAVVVVVRASMWLVKSQLFDFSVGLVSNTDPVKRGGEIQLTSNSLCTHPALLNVDITKTIKPRLCEK